MTRPGNNGTSSTTVRNRIQNHLNLSFSDERWAELLALIDGKIRLELRNRKINRKAALAEAKRVRAAAEILTKHIADSKTSAIDWADFAWTLQFTNAHQADSFAPDFEQVPRLNNWKADVLNLLGQFTTAARIVDSAPSSTGANSGRPADQHRLQFATCLAYHFIRAGGVFEDAPGRPGFPAFAKLVWELLPNDCRPNSADSFADTIGRGVDKDQLKFCCSSRADYCIQLTKCYWGIPA